MAWANDAAGAATWTEASAVLTTWRDLDSDLITTSGELITDRFGVTITARVSVSPLVTAWVAE